MSEVLEGSPCPCGSRLWAIVSREGQRMRLRCIGCDGQIVVEARGEMSSGTREAFWSWCLRANDFDHVVHQPLVARLAYRMRDFRFGDDARGVLEAHPALTGQ